MELGTRTRTQTQRVTQEHFRCSSTSTKGYTLDQTPPHLFSRNGGWNPKNHVKYFDYQFTSPLDNMTIDQKDYAIANQGRLGPNLGYQSAMGWFQHIGSNVLPDSYRKKKHQELQEQKLKSHRLQRLQSRDKECIQQWPSLGKPFNGCLSRNPKPFGKFKYPTKCSENSLSCRYVNPFIESLAKCENVCGSCGDCKEYANGLAAWYECREKCGSNANVLRVCGPRPTNPRYTKCRYKTT